MIRLKVIGQNGVEHAVDAEAKGVLMEVLRDFDHVRATCGGVCSCATCHVYVENASPGLLPAPQSDERELVSELQHRRESSRLSCQIRLARQLDGLRVTVAPEE